MDKKELEKNVDDILERGMLAEFLPTKEEFRNKLLSGKKLKFYMGFDATAKSLHLGHAQGLMILEDFRRLGHEVIFLIGDFTGMIGDPSDKTSTRIRQTPEDVAENIKNWKEQIKNIASFDDKENPFQIKYNSEWLGKLNFAQVLELASNFTVQQMLERDMFDKRMKEGRPIYVHEFMYPLMQGYDSVAMDVDVELCGTDQIFNALAGRTLMQKLKNKDKLVIATKLIADEKTGILMSKSNGTGVFLNLDANNLFGAIMAQSDGMIKPLAVGCTRISLSEIEEMIKLENPRDAKVRLAWEIVKIYHGEEKAKEAQEYFVNTFSKKELPEDIAELTGGEGESLIDFIMKAGFATSKSDARRKIEQGGVSIDGEKIPVGELVLTKDKFNGKILKVGKINFVKIVFES
ncbi:MAG: Tyrosine-tRNA ligase [Candidatus Moranbacteria bacterium GW2011_GWF1_34_10]|nr:MAG: Tyrosine-tRNA ligase [Candidatus Moranbacteria bacterium GW2011_GWF1_34_10]